LDVAKKGTSPKIAAIGRELEDGETRLLDLSPFSRESGILNNMSADASPFDGWTPDQIALARRWVETWKLAGAELERIARQELREQDTYRDIELLCGTADYTRPPWAPQPTSGLVELQRWFMRAAKRE
jgi:hypothetical protein